MHLTLLVALFGFIAAPVFGARILAIAPVPSYSHQVALRPIWKELSLRGHQVTLLTTDPMKDPQLTNLTEIDLHFTYIIWKKVNINDMAENGIIPLLSAVLNLGYEIGDEELKHPEVQALLKNDSERFDVVISENVIVSMYAFAERFKCPLIQISSLDASSVLYYAIGNPAHPVINPDHLLPYTGKLTFFQRLISVTSDLFLQYFSAVWYLPAQQLLISKHFGDYYPTIEEMAKNTSMLFVNTDLVFHQIRPLLPIVVQIGGGTHLKPAEPLPKHLENHLDKATEGAIYFSLGSNVQSKDLSKNTMKVLLETFSELPYTVLWKFEKEDLPGKPRNVIISTWFPQQDILRHPNIKLFITQCGLQSMDEAIYTHVPLVGMPFFGDQELNSNKIVSKGIGLSVDYNTLEKTTFKNTILEVINNPKYKNRIKELADLVKDQPMTGLERAVWWTEYVIRHKGTKHLRSPAVDLPLYQYFLLDVIGFCLLLLLIVIFLLVQMFKLIRGVIRCFGSRKVKTQ